MSAGEPCGDVQQPVAQRLRLGLREIAVQEQVWGPGDQVNGEHDDGQPSGVDGEAAGREVVEPGVLRRANPVLDPGVRAVSGIETGELPDAGVGAERGVAPAETREISVVSLHPCPDFSGEFFPHAAQAIKLVRGRRPLRPGGRWTTITVYAITSLSGFDADPGLLAGWIRGHWGIENRLHWFRDVTFDEDHSTVRTGHGPQVMTAFRNLAITALRLSSVTNIGRATPPRPRRTPPTGHLQDHVTTLPGPCPIPQSRVWPLQRKLSTPTPAPTRDQRLPPYPPRAAYWATVPALGRLDARGGPSHSYQVSSSSPARGGLSVNVCFRS